MAIRAIYCTINISHLVAIFVWTQPLRHTHTPSRMNGCVKKQKKPQKTCHILTAVHTRKQGQTGAKTGPGNFCPGHPTLWTKHLIFIHAFWRFCLHDSTSQNQLLKHISKLDTPIQLSSSKVILQLSSKAVFGVVKISALDLSSPTSQGVTLENTLLSHTCCEIHSLQLTQTMTWFVVSL